MSTQEHVSARVSALRAFLSRWRIIWLQPRRCCHAGSNVSLTLYFLRFAMGINAALAAFWLAGTVIPFIISPPNSFAWEYFKAYRPTELLQGYGLHNTFLVYGMFPSELGGIDGYDQRSAHDTLQYKPIVQCFAL